MKVGWVLKERGAAFSSGEERQAGEHLERFIAVNWTSITAKFLQFLICCLFLYFSCSESKFGCKSG